MKIPLISWLLARYFFIPLLHPLLFGTICLMLGILSSHGALGLLPCFFITLSILAVSLSIRAVNQLWSYLPFYMLSMYCAGYVLHTHQLEKLHSFFTRYTNKVLTIRGTITDIQSLQSLRYRQRILLSIDTISCNNILETSATTIAVYCKKNQFEVGDYIEMQDVTFASVENKSYLHYLCKEKISGSLFIDTFCPKKLGHCASFSSRIATFKNKLHAHFAHVMNATTFALFSSIFLGNKGAVKEEMDLAKEPFKIWGVSHYLARSGLHLVVFVIVWQLLLGIIPLPYFIRHALLTALILVYALLSWSSISFDRALLMFLIYKLCVFAHRPVHYLHLVVVVTNLVLLANPLHLFFLDFQLSFGLTFALAWFTSIEAHKKQRIA